MMLFSDHTFIGVDPTAGKTPFTYAALDSDLQLLALGEGYLKDIVAFCGGQQKALVAICSPWQPNIGKLKDESLRSKLKPAPKPGRYLDFRVAEYILRQHGITIPQTVSKRSKCPGWMQMGFKCYEQLLKIGYSLYADKIVDCRIIEVYPHACFTTLLEVIPYPKLSLLGRMQRQLLLIELGIALPDPMRIYEEFTRFKLLKGEIDLKQLYSPAELDAIVAAYTAWKISADSKNVILVGDEEEGQIAIPVPELLEHYNYPTGEA